MTSRELARALQAEFVIQFRAGMNDATEDALVEFIERELLRGRTTWDTERPNILWAHYIGGVLHFERNKAYADQCADGFTWRDPRRVRKVAIIYPEACHGR